MKKVISTRLKIKLFWFELILNIILCLGAIIGGFSGIFNSSYAVMILLINASLGLYFSTKIEKAKENLIDEIRTNIGDMAGHLLYWIIISLDFWDERDTGNVARNLTGSIRIATSLLKDEKLLPDGAQWRIEDVLEKLIKAYKEFISTGGKQESAKKMLEDLQVPLKRILNIFPFEGEMPSDIFQPKPTPDA